MRREASKVLCEARASIKARDTKRYIQLTSCPEGKHDPAVEHTTKHQSTDVSYDASIDDIDEEDDETAQAYYRFLCETFDADTSKPVFDEEFTRSSMEAPLYYDREGAPSPEESTSDLASTEEVGRKRKRKLNSGVSLEPAMNDLSDHADNGLKRRRLEEEVPGSSMKEPDDYDLEMAKAEMDGLFGDVRENTQSSGETASGKTTSGETTSDLVSTEEGGRKMKRKLNSGFSPEPTATYVHCK